MKKLSFYLGVILLTTLITQALLAYETSRRQQRVMLSLTIQEVELIMKALGKLPLEESGNLYMAIQQQAQTQLQPPQKPKADSTAKKKP